MSPLLLFVCFFEEVAVRGKIVLWIECEDEDRGANARLALIKKHFAALSVSSSAVTLISGARLSRLLSSGPGIQFHSG